MLYVSKNDWHTEIQIVGQPGQQVAYDRFDRWKEIPKEFAILGGRELVGFYHGFGVEDALDNDHDTHTESMQALMYAYFRRVVTLSDTQRRPTFEEWLDLCYFGDGDRLTAFGIFATGTGDILVVHYHRRKLTITDVTEHSVIHRGKVYNLKTAFNALIENRKEQLATLEKRCERHFEDHMDEPDADLFNSLKSVLR